MTLFSTWLIVCTAKKNCRVFLLAFLNNGKRSFYQAGFADPDRQMPFDSSTTFEIGSITKTFTAYVLTAVLMENNISETGPVINYLPDSVRQNQHLSSISFFKPDEPYIGIAQAAR
ncbi:MAG: serine hydrolase [Chitinophagaceae bacterium]|nr:serine hydrolase [Chitinophagaceae bacterium]